MSGSAKSKRSLGLLWLWLLSGVLLSQTSLAAYQHGQLLRQWQQSLATDLDVQAADYPYRRCFQDAAQRYQVALSLLVAVARGESHFNAHAVSSANAIGVMQIQWPGTAHHLGIYERSLLYDPCTNIDAGARYLRELIDQFGSVHTALAAYNYGPGRIRRAGTHIPQGALWYSSYIHDHWQTLWNNAGGRRRPVGNTGRVVAQAPSSTGSSPASAWQARLVELIRFGEPFRAQGLVRSLERQAPGLNFQWFKRGDGQFSVVAEFASREQALAAVDRLRQLGFRVAL